MTNIQIESEEGVDNVDDIISNDGNDAVIIDPSDLSMILGKPGQIRHQRIEEAYHRIIAGCDKHDVAPGIQLKKVEDMAKLTVERIRQKAFSYDIKLLENASRDTLNKLHSLLD